MGADFVDYVDLNLNDENLNAWDGSQSFIEPGDYAFEITAATVKTSKKGNPMLEVELKVVSDGAMKGRETRQWYSLKPDSAAARGRLKSLVAAAGIPTDERGGFAASALCGASFLATVAHEEYEDTDKDGHKVMKNSLRVIKERMIERTAPPAVTARGRTATPNGGPAARR